MTNEIEPIKNPFGTGAREVESAGSRGVQSRENSEVLALVMSAKRFPRDLVRVSDRIQNAFTRPTLAEKAQYQYAKGGTNITGPSIHAAEAIAQQWTNLSAGWRELTRWKEDGVGVSEVEAFCTDYENTNRSSITFVVRHWVDTRSGGRATRDEREVYELLANQAQRRKRAVILAQIPNDVVEMAMQQAAVTLTQTADTSPEGIAKLAGAFTEMGVTREQLEKRIQRRLETMQPAQMVTLRRIYASLRDEMSNVSDWFEVETAAAPADSSGLEKIRAAAKAKREKPVKTEATDMKSAGDKTDPATGEISAADNPEAGVDKSQSDPEKWGEA